jgi:hypothetical protein
MLVLLPSLCHERCHPLAEHGGIELLSMPADVQWIVRIRIKAL